MMAETPNLKLTLSPSSGWSEQYYEDFINTLSGDGNSNMKIIDTEVGGVKDTLTAVENALAEI
jgi:hypothetical protein